TQCRHADHRRGRRRRARRTDSNRRLPRLDRAPGDDGAPPWMNTTIGNVGSRCTARVDRMGLGTTWGDWSLDWWVRTDDEWRVAADERESKMLQRLVDATPVVETIMRLRSGDVCHRSYAIAGVDEFAVVEVTNRSPLPVAIAFALRSAVGERRDLTVAIDGRVALVLPRQPAREEDGAFVYPLPHTATMRVLLPLRASFDAPRPPA